MTQKYDYCIVITTFEREIMLKELLDDIFRDKKDKKVFVVIFDDGSRKKYDLNGYDVKYIKYLKNNGLKKVWKIITDTFKFCEKINADYFFYLQDDLRLKENFFEKSIKIFESIKDDNKISLGTLMIETQRNVSKWTNILPVDMGEYYKTQWCELVFVCKKNFFEKLGYEIKEIDPKRWDVNPNLSCGVGDQISHRFLSMGLNMYHVKDSLTIHGDHESMFYKEHRKNEKLIAK